MIRLAFLCNSPTVPAGVEKTALLLQRGLDPTQFAVRFILNRPGPFSEDLGHAGADVEVLPCYGRLSPGWYSALARSLRKRPADVVQLHLSRLSALAIRRCLPIAIVERLNMMRTCHGFFPLRWAFLDRLTSRWIDQFIVVSQALRHQFEARGYPPQKLSVVYNGVEASPPAPSLELRRRLGLPACGPLVATAGRLTPQKGMDTFVAAAGLLCKTHPNIHFAIIGEGCDRPRLLQQIHRLGIERQVHLLGYQTDLVTLMPAFDIFALLSRWEPFANVLLEAMSAGRPIVASAVDGNLEAVQNDQTGILVPPGRPEEAAAAFRMLLANPQRATRYGRAAADRATHFSIASMIAGHARVYQRLASAPLCAEVIP